MCFAPQRRALFRHLNLQKWREHVVFCIFWLRNVLRATTASTFSTSELPKVARTCGALYILTWKCASRHNGVHFFDISTSKSGPNLVCFVHFDFKMCFAPQRRALFRNLNFQRWSENGVFCTFWLGNVLRATTACNFSSLIWPAGSAPAALASLLFDPLEPQIIWKTQCFATFLPFRASASSSYSFSSTLLSSNLSLFSASSLLCFSFVHIVGSLTSKLPSIITHGGRTLDQYNMQELRDLFLEMFCTTRTAVDNPMMQLSGSGQRRSFLVLEEGELEGTDGYWAEDDEDGAEGFLDALEDVFWV